MIFKVVLQIWDIFFNQSLGTFFVNKYKKTNHICYIEYILFWCQKAEQFWLLWNSTISGDNYAANHRNKNMNFIYLCMCIVHIDIWGGK